MQVIIPGEPMRYGLRLVAYAPNGNRLGLLPQHLGFESGFPLNDVPSLRLSYSKHAPGASFLAAPCELAVEYSIGGSWIEPADARFLRIKRGTDNADQASAYSYDCPGWAWQLRKLVLYPHSSMVDGKRPFNGVSPGAILKTLINEGQARGTGTLPGLIVDFDTTTDSNGQAWDKVLTIGLEPGTDLLTLLINLSEQGVLDWQMQGRELLVFNEGTVLARDLATGPAPVELRLGRDLLEAPDDATLEDVSSAILVVGESGLQVEVTNPSALAPWGRWESYQSQGGVSDVGTAMLLGQNALERTSKERVQLTRTITPYSAAWLPFGHYRPGDFVRAPGDGAAMAALRLRQITLSCSKEGVVSGNLILNDRFLEREIKLARQAAGILAGGVSSGGNGGEPQPDTDGRVPASPAGLIVDAAAYLDEHGYARGQATVTWGAVTADTNGVALDVDGYELYARKNEPGQFWLLVGQTASGDTQTTISSLVVGWEYAFKVRAINGGTKGVFSSQVVVVMPDDATPPPIPSAPVVTSRLGVIHVEWDGFGSAGEAMPADFDRVFVWMKDPLVPADTGAKVGYLTAAGTEVIPGQPYGADREIWLTAVDRSRNESAATAHQTVATQPLVNTDVIGQVLDGTKIIDGTLPANAKIVANSITGALIQALAIDAGKIAANAITADKITAGAVQAAHVAANAITADKITAGAIDASKLTATAIDGKTITGAFIRTAASGRRLEFAPPGATYPEMRFIPASGGSNYTRLRTRDDMFSGEATFEVTSGTNSGSTAASQTTIAAGFMQMQVRDASLSNPNGGLMELAESYARYGYFKDGEREQFFWFDSSGRTRHVGKWWDFTNLGPTAGILAGSLVFASAGSGANIRFLSYGSPLDGNPGPVVALRRGLSSPTSHTPSGSWYLTESLSNGFRISSSFPDGFAVYWWVHRH